MSDFIQVFAYRRDDVTLADLLMIDVINQADTRGVYRLDDFKGICALFKKIPLVVHFGIEWFDKQGETIFFKQHRTLSKSFNHRGILLLSGRTTVLPHLCDNK